jgi:DNA-binding NtrC family response regulator
LATKAAATKELANSLNPRERVTFERRSRVLIADSDPGLRRGLSKRLIDAEVFADSAGDGKQALEQIGAGSYSVVVLDLALAHSGAERVIDAIGAMAAAAKPIVLVLGPAGSSRSLDVDVVQIVLRKPCDLEQLSEIVRSCVRSTAASQRAAPPLTALAGETLL